VAIPKSGRWSNLSDLDIVGDLGKVIWERGDWEKTLDLDTLKVKNEEEVEKILEYPLKGPRLCAESRPRSRKVRSPTSD
jgi:hypothetical protein